MFKIGDTVVHPTQGVGVVQNLMSVPALSKRLKYYKIKMLNGTTETTLMIPVKRAAQLGLRSTISEADLAQVWDVLAAPPQTLAEDYKQRYKVLREKLKQSDLQSTGEVVRDLAWRRKQNGKLNAPARRIYSKALRLLANELAVSKDIKPRTAKRYITQQLEDNFENLPDRE
jgi:CarD family transcriptional regulator